MDNFEMTYSKCFKCPHATVQTDEDCAGVVINCDVTGDSLYVDECPYK